MLKLPILEKNAYLSILIKDDTITSQLAYTDYNANRSYILNDHTDLTPLRRRLDDEFFTKNFWYEYFDNLENVFNWDIVNKKGSEIFYFEKFLNEGKGISGIKVLVDDNQKYFTKIFSSLKNFSQDISLRILDDNYMRLFLNDMSERLGYKDVLLVDMDLQNFSIYRSTKNEGEGEILERKFKKMKVNWENEYGVIDSLKDARIKAFLSTELSQKEMLNTWSNFVLNKKQNIEDPNLQDILRAYTTIQLYSIYQNNKHTLIDFGTKEGECAVILTGTIPKLLNRKTILLSIIDGLGLNGIFDTYWNYTNNIYTYGRSYIEGNNSADVILRKVDIFKSVTKTVIPEVKKQKGINKVIMNGYIDSLDLGKSEFYALSKNFSLFELPKSEEKLVFEAQMKNGSKLPSVKNGRVSFLSSHGDTLFDSILVDGRLKPTVYGPDIYTNRTKLQKWLNDN